MSLISESTPAQDPGTWGLLVLHALAFAATLLVGYMLDGTAYCADFPSPFVCGLALGWKSNEAIAAQGAVWRLVTAAMVHGGGLHLLVNGSALYAVGPLAERAYGWRQMVGIYFCAGIAGNFLSYLGNPNPAVGASGSIFGLIAALIVVRLMTPSAVSPGHARWLLIGAIGTLLLGFPLEFIDNAGHIGGLLGGALAGWALADSRHPSMIRWLVPSGVSVGCLVVPFWLTGAT